MPSTPTLITFDIFGTVLDWRSGLEASCLAASRPLMEGEFDRIVDVQGAIERDGFLDYATVACRSLVEVIGMAEATAAGIAARMGLWPLYSDAGVLSALMRTAPCAAMTNSDRIHGEDVQTQLGFRLSDWLCSEDTAVYKPDPDFWRCMAHRREVSLGPDWWHVSAYADYDLKVANSLGLTTVFVARPHARPGDSSHAVKDLHGLLDLLRSM